MFVTNVVAKCRSVCYLSSSKSFCLFNAFWISELQIKDGGPRYHTTKGSECRGGCLNPLAESDFREEVIREWSGWILTICIRNFLKYMDMFFLKVTEFLPQRS